ncbi:MAG: EAL domain-containing protein [Phycisphaeraceae bacterium]|nr:EAL domain-containing protein [Phycisphaeraceae bacterium]
MERMQKVLVIDDSPMVHRLVRERLREEGVEFLEALDGGTGLRLAREGRPELILLDMNLPDMTGLEVCRRIQEDEGLRSIPVIFLTGSEDREVKLRAFEAGAVDYVTKPFDAAELRARVGATLRTQALMERLECLAWSDPLTGLPNRAALHRALDRCLARARVRPGYKMAVLFLDLDRFKLVNDSLGHEAGDQLLMTVAERLREALSRVRGGGTDVVARMGGDEFVLLLDDIPSVEEASEVAERVCRQIAAPVSVGAHRVQPSASMGLRMGSAEDGSAEELLRDSDTALYHAKAVQRGGCVMFDGKMHHQVLTRLQMENDLRGAVGRGEFVLHYQPIVGLEDGRLRAFEALIRWQHPGKGLIPPGLFIPVAEELGVITEIGAWALGEACGQLGRWRELGRGVSGTVRMGVNLSKKQLEDPGLIECVRGSLTAGGLESKDLTLEVTESVIMHNPATVVPAMARLRGLGMRLAMDDFGTGYSSLASLHRFPLDILKIDRAFVHCLAESRAHSAIVQAIITLAHNLELSVVGEGVETEEQLAQLQALECDAAQGYLFARPAAAEEAGRMMAEGVGEGVGERKVEDGE